MDSIYRIKTFRQDLQDLQDYFNLFLSFLMKLRNLNPTASEIYSSDYMLYK